MAYDLLVTMQALFLATTIWDFFLTVLVQSSQRALVFSGLGNVATVWFVIAPWAVCIALLVITFIIFLIYHDHRPIQTHIHYYYGFLGLMYIAFAILAFSNPLVMWPVIMSYIVNVIWVGFILYYRILVSQLYESK